MLGGVPACNGQSVPSVQTGNVLSIIKRFIERMNNPAVYNLHIENFRFTDSALVGWLPSFIRMKYDRLYRDLTVTDRLGFDLYFIDIRICPV
jgi:hypothetical protein